MVKKKSLRPSSFFVPHLILSYLEGPLAHVCKPQPAGPNTIPSCPKEPRFEPCHVVPQVYRPKGSTWVGWAPSTWIMVWKKDGCWADTSPGSGLLE